MSYNLDATRTAMLKMPARALCSRKKIRSRTRIHAGDEGTIERQGNHRLGGIVGIAL
jgi:hypothetical protein